MSYFAYGPHLFTFDFFFQTLSQNESNDATASAVEGLCWFMQERSWCVTWERTQVFQRLAWEVGGTLEAGVKKKGFIPTKPKFYNGTKILLMLLLIIF